VPQGKLKPGVYIAARIVRDGESIDAADRPAGTREALPNTIAGREPRGVAFSLDVLRLKIQENQDRGN
jgi:hypothetical protein